MNGLVMLETKLVTPVIWRTNGRYVVNAVCALDTAGS